MVSSPVVSGRFATSQTPRRVYTIAFVLIVGVALVGVGCRAPAPGAQERFGVETYMSRGPASAPVTIVEFSDYQ